MTEDGWGHPWKYRVHLIAPAGLIAQSRAFAAQVDPDTGGAETFTAPLSPTGKKPATHYGASTQMTDAGLASLFNMGPQIPGARYEYAETGAARPWPEFCALHGLVSIVVEDVES